jgi:hypothetical protein
VAHKQRPEKPGLQPSEGEANRMDWPAPGSGGAPRPEPVATGFKEPIEAAAEASAPRGPSKSAASRRPGVRNKH